MKSETPTKTFDAVAFMRAARQRLAKELAGKTFAQQHAILSQSVPGSVKPADESQPAKKC